MAAGRISLVMLYLWVGAVTMVSAHPQCLDFRPPFEVTGGLRFCTQYAYFGCCSAGRDSELKDQYNRIAAETRLPNADGPSSGAVCSRFLKDVLCQECSPYAAHIYDAEADLVKAPLPGMCTGYCGEFYDRCGTLLVPHLTNASPVLQSMTSRAAFCAQNAIGDADYCYPGLLDNPVLVGNVTRSARTEEGCLCLEEFAKDLRNPVIFNAPPDATGRIFVGEQLGIISIFHMNGTRLTTPFMDLTHMVLTSGSAGDERGLLGLAFHPDFKQNRFLFVYFTIRHPDQSQKVRISRFTADVNNPNRVENNSERVVLEVHQPYSNHNGGQVLFGFDGYLYAFLGDGGAGGDPHNYAQNKSVLLGKVLRLDVSVTAAARPPYTVPADNPFIAEPGALPEIYATGIRNAWRCDLDEGHPVTGYGRGRIICGDVGQSAYEEIDIIKRGGNYGWNTREGFSCYNNKCGLIGKEELPIYAYSHAVGKSVTGGHVYRGCMSPNLQGLYIYGDYVTGKVFRLRENTQSSVWENKQLRMCGPDTCFNGLTHRYDSNILSFGEDSNGEMYMLTTSWASPTASSGTIFKLVDPRRRGDPTTCRSYKNIDSTNTTTTTTTTTTSTITTTTPKPTTTTTRPTTTTTTSTGSCVDAPTRFCRSLKPFYCYDASSRRYCCATCRAFQTGIAGCEYGDRATWCKNYASDPYHCHGQTLTTCCKTCRQHPNVYDACRNKSRWCENLFQGYCYSRTTRNTCCARCQQGRTNRPGCQYGDSLKWCHARYCNTSADRCCSSCANWTRG